MTIRDFGGPLQEARRLIEEGGPDGEAFRTEIPDKKLDQVIKVIADAMKGWRETRLGQKLTEGYGSTREQRAAVRAFQNAVKMVRRSHPPHSPFRKAVERSASVAPEVLVRPSNRPRTIDRDRHVAQLLKIGLLRDLARAIVDAALATTVRKHPEKR